MRPPPPSRHVFGPVPSRRLGRSLGVDLVPFKTCSFDCIYCQLGRTTMKTRDRRDWVPVDEVLEEVKTRLPARPDYVTLSGSGEPTLHARLGEILSGLKRLTDIPVAVLTNGSLLDNAAVREALAEADLVIPSLDAGDAALFKLVNRPCEGVAWEGLLDGLESLRRGYRGPIWLEVFLLGGITAIPSEVEKIARLARRIAPDRIQLNTVARPPAERFAEPVPRGQLERLAALFDGGAEVIADPPPAHPGKGPGTQPDDVLALLRRRPCTVRDIEAGLGLHRNEAVKHIARLERDGLLTVAEAGGESYYQALGGTSDAPAAAGTGGTS